jgi:hypothetical protein
VKIPTRKPPVLALAKLNATSIYSSNAQKCHSCFEGFLEVWEIWGKIL